MKSRKKGRTGDGADDDDTLEGVCGRLLDVGQQQIGQQEVAQVVGGHTQLVAVRREGGLLGGWQVHRRVAHQHIQPPPSRAEVLHADAKWV